MGFIFEYIYEVLIEGAVYLVSATFYGNEEIGPKPRRVWIARLIAFALFIYAMAAILHSTYFFVASESFSWLFSDPALVFLTLFGMFFTIVVTIGEHSLGNKWIVGLIGAVSLGILAFSLWLALT